MEENSRLLAMVVVIAALGFAVWRQNERNSAPDAAPAAARQNPAGAPDDSLRVGRHFFELRIFAPAEGAPGIITDGKRCWAQLNAPNGGRLEAALPR